MQIIRRRGRHLVFFIISVGVLLGSGCRFPWTAQPSIIEVGPAPEALKAYGAATAKFQAGAYEDAANQFANLRDHSADKRVARMALFGLALSRLVAADTPEDHLQALKLWENWIQVAPDVRDHENAALFDALVQEKMLLSNIPPGTPEKTPPVADDTAVPNWLFIRTKLEMDRLRGQLEESQAKLKKQQTQVERLKKEIATLKQQIKALEAIDQKIQKKKNAIPSAE